MLDESVGGDTSPWNATQAKVLPSGVQGVRGLKSAFLYSGHDKLSSGVSPDLSNVTHLPHPPHLPSLSYSGCLGFTPSTNTNPSRSASVRTERNPSAFRSGSASSGGPSGPGISNALNP